ncbi:unnamed protein product [Caenorhabditis brenneri]
MFITNIVPVVLLFVSANAIGLPDEAIYNRSRFERATDKEFSTSIKQMEMISRITNGISLRQGLSRGSISNEELISELLNLGDVEPSDIERIDTVELKKLVENIQKLSETIPKTESSDPIEERLDKLNSFLQNATNEKEIEEPGKGFVDAVTKIKDSPLDWDDSQLFAKLLGDLHTRANEIVNVKSNNQHVLADSIHQLKSVLERIMFITTDISPFEEELAGVSISEAKKKVEAYPMVVETVKEFEKVQNDSSYNSKTDDTVINSLENSMNVLATVIEKMWNDLETIHIIEKLYIFRRHKRGNRDSKLIPGFSSDTSELGLLFKDLKDSWLQTNTKEQTNILEKVFQPFSALREKTKKVEGSFGTISDASFAGMNLVLSQVKYLSQFSHITGLPSDTLKNALKSSAEAKELVPSINDKIEKLNKNMIQICKYIFNVKPMLKIWKAIALQKKENKLSELLILATPPDDDSKAAELLAKIQNDANFKNVLNIVQGSEKYTETSNYDFELKKIAEAVVDDYEEIIPFVREANNFLKTIEPMRQFSKLSDPKSVFENIKTIKNDIEYNDFGEKVNIDPVIVSIENTKSALKELDDTINSMKQAKGSEIDGLVGMTDATESARNIGSATKAISSMNKFLDLDTSRLDPAVKEVQRRMSLQASIEHKNTVKALVALVYQISNFKHEIKSFKASVQPITSSKLSDYSEIFEKAKSVKGIGRDFLKLSFSVENLKKEVLPDDEKIIDEIKDLLVTMDKLCLTYSKYQTVFDGSKNTLNNIDLLFTSLQNSMTATTPAPILPTTDKDINTYASFSSCSKVKDDGLSAAGVIAIVLAAVLVLLMLAASTIGVFYNMKKKKNSEK